MPKLHILVYRIYLIDIMFWLYFIGNHFYKFWFCFDEYKCECCSHFFPFFNKIVRKSSGHETIKQIILMKNKTIVECLASNFFQDFFPQSFLPVLDWKTTEKTMKNFSGSPKYDAKHWAIVKLTISAYVILRSFK